MTLIRVTQKYGPEICILDHFALLFWVVVVGLFFGGDLGFAITIMYIFVTKLPGWNMCV